ncbi:MAG: hypothetical protein Dasosvirus3_19 [Dasosvirus sp.]|uniref:Uncharacterized protein n=1 Tax=Dasosvirus sp. TaxID=2487764 RepID=A0A3G4ZRC7_9VIRU|nr:MAG: hypothetical protein Dasosvirus3_19 [Dasosvirus sp.]
MNEIKNQNVKNLYPQIPVTILKYYLNKVPTHVLKTIIPMEVNYEYDGNYKTFLNSCAWTSSRTSLYHHFQISCKYNGTDGYFQLLPSFACMKFDMEQLQYLEILVKKYGEGRLMTDLEYPNLLNASLGPYKTKSIGETVKSWFW